MDLNKMSEVCISDMLWSYSKKRYLSTMETTEKDKHNTIMYHICWYFSCCNKTKPKQHWQDSTRNSLSDTPEDSLWAAILCEEEANNLWKNSTPIS